MKTAILCALIASTNLYGFDIKKIVVDAHGLSAPTDEQRAFWLGLTAPKLLERLEHEESAFLTVPTVCYNFVRDEDVPALAAQLDSKERSAYLISSPSSMLPDKHSTVGQQAAHLIDCYRQRYCPVGLGSHETNINEIKAWYARWRLQSPEKYPALKN